jgi:hypothetical protein
VKANVEKASSLSSAALLNGKGCKRPLARCRPLIPMEAAISDVCTRARR